MDLHHTPGKPQWELLPKEQWNKYQQRAAATNGWDTPGNRESAKGLVITLAGITSVALNQPLWGLVLIGWGRWKDVKDGKVAAQTGTKSPRGEAVDAAVDKIIIAAALPVIAIKDIVAPIIVIGLALQHGLSIIFTAIAKQRGRKIQPRQAGKITGFIQWTGICMSLVAKVLQSSRYDTLGRTIESLAVFLVIIGFILGIAAAGQYALDAFRGRPAKSAGSER